MVTPFRSDQHVKLHVWWNSTLPETTDYVVTITHIDSEKCMLKDSPFENHKHIKCAPIVVSAVCIYNAMYAFLYLLIILYVPSNQTDPDYVFASNGNVLFLCDSYADSPWTIHGNCYTRNRGHAVYLIKQLLVQIALIWHIHCKMQNRFPFWKATLKW